MVFIDGVGFEHSMAPGELSEALAKISSSRTAARQLRDELKSAISTSPEEALPASAVFLASTDVVLAAAIRANMHLKERQRATLERCLSMPSILKVQSPLEEPSYVRARPKKSGGFRVTHDFGLQHRTSQGMVLRVMERYLVPRSFQYTFRGIHRAIAEVKLLLPQGLVYFATLDIKDHFGSFDPEKLASLLPISKEWVNHVVVGRHIAAVVEKSTGSHSHAHSPTDMLLTQARQGIPQGSACSPIVGAFCMAHLQWISSPGTALLNFADNFLLLASSASGLEECIGNLTAAVAKLPGGHFQLKIVQQGHANAGFDFLGHRMRLKGSQVQTSISPANCQDIFREMRRLDKKFPPANAPWAYEQTMKCLERMCVLLKGWVHAFRGCDDISRWEVGLLCMIEENAGPLLGKKVPHIYEMASGGFEYTVGEYAFV